MEKEALVNPFHVCKKPFVQLVNCFICIANRVIIITQKVLFFYLPECIYNCKSVTYGTVIQTYVYKFVSNNLKYEYFFLLV